MKLLFAHECFGAFAGAESNILAAARGLNDRGHTTGIAHGPATGRGEKQWEETFQPRFPLTPRNAGPQIRSAIEQFQPDVVYLHKLADLDALQAVLSSGVPAVRMVHDHDLYCLRSYKYNYFTRRICERPASLFCLVPCGAFVVRDPQGWIPLKWAGYRAKQEEIRLNQKFARLMVASRFMKEELLRNGFDPARIEIHPPVPPPGDPSLQSNFSDRNLVLYAGQITRGKGVDVLLESLALVRVPFECFIFGDGNQRAACEKLCRRLGLANRVHFKGYVLPEELAIYQREASLAVMSSVWPEPFGAVGLEFMRHGLPVVAFDAGGIKEWLTDGRNGRLVPWMDRAAFAASVEDLLRNKALARQLGAQGRALVAECYGFSKYLDGLEHLFQRVAGKLHQPLAA